jgi:hypothetical protein
MTGASSSDACSPGESPAVFGDALRSLSDRSTYLYDNAGR